jgi:hypothetical protein
MQVQKPSASAAVQSLREFLLQTDVEDEPAARASLAQTLGYRDWRALVANVRLPDTADEQPTPANLASDSRNLGQRNRPPSEEVLEFMESLKTGRLAVWHRRGQTFPRLLLVDEAPFVSWKEGRAVNWLAPVAQYVEVGKNGDVASGRSVEMTLEDVRQLRRDGVHWRIGAVLVLVMSRPESLATLTPHFYTKS